MFLEWPDTLSLTEFVWLLATGVGCALYLWMTWDAWLDYCVSRTVSEARAIVSYAAVRRSAIVAQVLGIFFLVGTVAAYTPPAYPDVWATPLSAAVAGGFFSSAVLLVIMAVLDRRDRYRALDAM